MSKWNVLQTSKRWKKKVKSLVKHLDIVSQTNLKMESMQSKIEDLDKWRNMVKSVSSGLLEIKAYDIKLHTMGTNECQELASKFEERARQSLVVMMDVYEKSVQEVQKYLQWPKINFIDEHPISFSLFYELQDTYKVVKVEVHSKEFISKEDIQEILVKSSKEFSLYTDCIHKFMVSMENYK